MTEGLTLGRTARSSSTYPSQAKSLGQCWSEKLLARVKARELSREGEREQDRRTISEWLYQSCRCRYHGHRIIRSTSPLQELLKEVCEYKGFHAKSHILRQSFLKKKDSIHFNVLYYRKVGWWNPY